MIIKTKFNQVPLNRIKTENRNFVISKLETGDLIKTKGQVFPLIYHYGIVEKNLDGVFVIHNHPDKFNSKGGNTVREPLDKWIENRYIVSVEQTNLKLEDIEKIYQELKKYKYDFINFNCEHFVNFAKDKSYVSPQVLRWTSVALIGLAIYFLLKNKRI
jgi:hypothetical protein